MGTTALTEAVFYILLSLDTPLHGYGIMQNVEHLSGGRRRHALRRARNADRARLDRLARRRERGTQKGVPDHARGPRGCARGAEKTA